MRRLSPARRVAQRVRNVFARCDTSADKAANAAQTNAALAEFTKQMRETCPGGAAAPKN